MKIRATQAIMECLLEQGVDTVFGYPGGTILNVYDELYRYQDRIRHILTAHEQGAAHAADGYARSTGKVGVCFATSGPGATNLTTGIATAYLDSSPVVFITCNVGENLLGKDAFQEVDITGAVAPFSKHSYLVKNANTEKALDVPAMLDKIGGKGAADIIGKYFSGQALIPNYRNMTLSDYLAPQDILNELDLCEDTFYQMFILDGISYEYEPPFLLNPEAFLADVDAAGVRYNTDEIQSLVENFSPELHQLLLQYAYRAMLAGVDDITKLDMKGAIYEQTNFQKWLDYCQETGAQAIASPNASN